MDYINSDIQKQYIIDVVDKFLPHQRKPTYSNEYYLTCFVHVKNTVTSWEKLKYLKCYKSNGNDDDYHWKSIENKYKQWCDNDIFKIAKNNMSCDICPLLIENNDDNVLILEADVTKINNKHGSENIGVNVEYTKKNVTALLTITNEKIPLYVVPLNSSKKVYKKDTKHFTKSVKKLDKKYKNDMEANKADCQKKILLKQQKMEKKKVDAEIEYNNYIKNSKQKKNRLLEKQKRHNKNVRAKNKMDKQNKDAEILFLEQQKKINDDSKSKIDDIDNKYKNNIKLEKKKCLMLNKYLKKINIMTFEHETKAIQRALNQIKIDVSNYNTIYLIGDGAYNLDNNKYKFYIGSKEVILVAPKNIKDTTRYPKYYKYLLSKRYIIENYFSDFKSCPRVNVRNDKLISTYMGFVDLQITEHYCKLLA